MKVLFDQNIPRKLRPYLELHVVETALDMGWDRLSNGDLLRQAESAGFDVLITADQNLFYQQNNSKRRIALIVLSANSWKLVKPYAKEIAAALDRCVENHFEEIYIPLPS